jgi:hypothetical protein
MDTAHQMRVLMGRDLDEYELAKLVFDENERLNRTPELLQGAWQVLTSDERRAWKTFVAMEKHNG